MALICRHISFTFVLLAAITAASVSAIEPPQAFDSQDEIVLTTTSGTARTAFRAGLTAIEHGQARKAHKEFQEAIKADPNFALAHLFAAYDNSDPAEEVDELTAARNLGPKASKGEQQMITWLSGSRNGDYLAGISAMNDLLGEYPRDRFLLFLAGRWMVQQRNFDLAAHVLERAVALDPNYPAALNELGYAYAYMGDFPKAYTALEKYVALAPNQPNADDSYGEVSRLSGHYEQAIEHFRKALAVDPTFIHAQLGLAETYMMMGDEKQARSEFAKAIRNAATSGEKLSWETASALSYAYENDGKSLAESLRKVAAEAKAENIGMLEANAYHLISMCSSDADEVMQNGRKAEEVISRVTRITPTDNDEQLASVLRTEAIHSAAAGNMGSASEALEELRMLALNSRSIFVQMTNEGAVGGVLWAQGKYQDAIPHLMEDQWDPLSLARLASALHQTGQTAQEKQTLERLSNFHQPTLSDLLARRLIADRDSKTKTSATK